MPKVNLRNKIKEVAKDCFINATEEFCEKVEEEVEKAITPELLEKVRSSMLKKPAGK